MLVRGLERIGDLLRDRQRFVEGDRPARDPLRQIVTLDQLHHKGAHTAALLDPVDGGDMRMIEGRQRVGFAREPPEALGVVGENLRQDFDRDIAIELRIPGPIDFAHSSRADLAEDFVDAQSSAGGERHFFTAGFQFCRSGIGPAASSSTVLMTKLPARVTR